MVKCCGGGWLREREERWERRKIVLYYFNVMYVKVKFAMLGIL